MRLQRGGEFEIETCILALRALHRWYHRSGVTEAFGRSRTHRVFPFEWTPSMRPDVDNAEELHLICASAERKKHSSRKELKFVMNLISFPSSVYHSLTSTNRNWAFQSRHQSFWLPRLLPLLSFALLPHPRCRRFRCHALLHSSVRHTVLLSHLVRPVRLGLSRPRRFPAAYPR